MLNTNQIDFLKIIADPTRCHILEILTKNPPQNPAEIAEKLDLKRPGIEKHMKALKSVLLVEKLVESWPTPRYVWTTTPLGDNFQDRLVELLNGFFLEAQIEIAQRVDSLEEEFILGKINRIQFDDEKNRFQSIKENFGEKTPYKDYLDAALKMKKEIEDELEELGS